MTITLYHGAHSELTIGHEGQCLTDDMDIAESYAGNNGAIYEVELDLGALTVEECEGYDRDEDVAPADRDAFRAAAAARGVDILIYDDEDVRGREHTCYRLVSDRAVAMVRAAGVEVEREDDDGWDDDGWDDEERAA